MGVLDFLSKEAGQKRRAALDEFGRDIGYYVPPELRGLLGFIAGATPTATIDRAAQAGGQMMAPGKTPMERVGAAGRMLSETAGVAAPAMVAGKAAMPAAQALQEGLLGFSVGGKMAGQEALRRANQRQPMPDRLGVFAGSNALTADKAALKTAQNMADAGASRDEIWRDTGWFQGVDGKWRFEIDDKDIALRPFEDAVQIGEAMRSEAKGLLSDIKRRNADLKIQPDLFPAELRKAHGEIRRRAEALKGEAGSNYGPEWNPQTLGQRAEYAVTGPLSDVYPKAMRETIVRTRQSPVDYSGSYNGAQDRLDLTRAAKDERSTLLHELQHMIQGNEGFARGSNPTEGMRMAQSRVNDAALRSYDEMRSIVSQSPIEIQDEFAKFEADPDAPFMREAFANLGPQARLILQQWDNSKSLAQAANNLTDENALAFYRRMAGEVESRNVQARADFTPEQRRVTPPWKTMDVPESAQIVRFGESVPQETRQYLGGLL